MNFLRPRRLKRGDHVRIVGPSGPLTEKQLDPALVMLESWGLRASPHPSTFTRDRYLAGSDHTRLAALQAALDDQIVDAILCSRGGYGAMRIVDQLDLKRFKRDPRIISGFSDITALHMTMQAAGFATLHGHVAKSFVSQMDDIELFKATLFGERGEVRSEVTTVREGRARGPVMGGNLSLVVAMAAAGRLPPLKGALLFLEDVTEEDYRLDRLFTSLRLNPAFADVAGVILGSFDQCAGTYVSEDEMPAFLASLAGELGDAWGVPVVMDFPAGHAGRNVPLPFGVPALVDANHAVVIQTEELVVRV